MESGRLIFGGEEAAEESKNGRSKEQSESAVIAAGPGVCSHGQDQLQPGRC